MTTADGELRFDVSGGRLMLTAAPSAVTVCDDCPDMHVVILERATADQIIQLADGLRHLAGHVRAREASSS